LEHEIPRQIGVVERGGSLSQETRRWDDVAGITEVMRTKEMAHDYRYFPDPDLMPLEPSEAWLEEVRRRVVELPLARKRRFMREHQLPAGDAESFKNDVELGDYFERLAVRSKNPKSVANWVINNLRAQAGRIGETLADLRFPEEGIGGVGRGGGRGPGEQQDGAGDFWGDVREGERPGAIIQRKGLVQVSDAGALESWCDRAMAENPRSVADYQAGKVAALNYLKGQVMKLSQGKANPNLVGEILARKLQDRPTARVRHETETFRRQEQRFCARQHHRVRPGSGRAFSAHPGRVVSGHGAQGALALSTVGTGALPSGVDGAVWRADQETRRIGRGTAGGTDVGVVESL
jgi:aspartyl-tRNA(Asn)/glutamyl-tRNA(Gln) amidotransferase subunit B